MIKKFKILIVAILCIQFIYAQDDNTKVYEFQGGKINLDLMYYTGFIYGIGSRNLNTNSTLENYGTESIYWNPAGLAFMQKSQIFVDYSLPIAVNPNAFVDFQEEINSNIDDEFQSNLANNAIYNYPDLNTSFPSGSRIQSIALAMPFNNFAFGFSYYSPFEFKLDFVEAGFRAFFIDNDTSSTEQQTAFRASGDMNAFFNLYAESYSMAFAYKFTEQFAAGLTVEYYNIYARAKANLNFYGSIAIGYNGNFGETILFNDPSRGYPNSLFSTMDGKFAGNSWGIRLGSSYRIGDFGEVAFTSHIPFTAHLDGNLTIVQNSPDFFKDGEIDEDLIDPNQTTRTEQTIYNSKGMRIKLPGNVNLGYTHAFGGFSLVTNIGFHFNQFSYDYSNTETHSNDSTVVERSYMGGIKMNTDLRLGLDFGAVKIGGGAIFAEEVRDDNETPSSFVIPVFSLAFGMPIGENIRVDANLLSLSMPLSRITLSYLF